MAYGLTACGLTSVLTASHLRCREIRRLQRTSELLIPRAPMCRFLRELMHEREKDSKSMGGPINRITAGALEALQTAAEAYLVGLFENAQVCAIHGKRITVMCAPLPHPPALLHLLRPAALRLCCYDAMRAAAALRSSSSRATCPWGHTHIAGCRTGRDRRWWHAALA